MKIVSNYAHDKNNFKTKSRNSSNTSFGTLNVSEVLKTTVENENFKNSITKLFEGSEHNPVIVLKRLKEDILKLAEKFSDDGLPELPLKSLTVNDGTTVGAEVGFAEPVSELAKKFSYGEGVSRFRNIPQVENIPFYSYETIERAYKSAQEKVKDLLKVDSLLNKNKSIQDALNQPNYRQTFAFLEQYHPNNVQIFESFLKGCNYENELIRKDSGIKIVSVFIDKVQHPHLMNEFYKGQYRVRAVAQIGSNTSRQIEHISPNMNAYNGNGEIVGAIENNTRNAIRSAYNKARDKK